MRKGVIFLFSILLGVVPLVNAQNSTIDPNKKEISKEDIEEGRRNAVKHARNVEAMISTLLADEQTTDGDVREKLFAALEKTTEARDKLENISNQLAEGDHKDAMEKVVDAQEKIGEAHEKYLEAKEKMFDAEKNEKDVH